VFLASIIKAVTHNPMMEAAGTSETSANFYDIARSSTL
jgi:hypothetical protein